MDDLYLPNLRFPITEPELLIDTLKSLGVMHCHLHHTIGYKDIIYTAVPRICSGLVIAYDVTIHDYFSICPRINLITLNEKKEEYYCGEPAPEGCNRCISRNGSFAGDVTIEAWRGLNFLLLRHARRVFVPSQDVANRMKNYLPEVTFSTHWHPEDIPVCAIPYVNAQTSAPLRIALIGALFGLKGAELIRAMIHDAHARKLPIEFHLIGYFGLPDESLHRLSNVRITGKYDEANVYTLLHFAACDIALFASIWPETYAYTLSIAANMGLHAVAFDMGAIAERLKTVQCGTILPVELMQNPAVVNDHLLGINLPKRSFNNGGTKLVVNKTESYPSLLHDYYQLPPLKVTYAA